MQDNVSNYSILSQSLGGWKSEHIKFKEVGGLGRRSRAVYSCKGPCGWMFMVYFIKIIDITE